MNTQFATNVHTFTGCVVDMLFENFNGRSLGGDEGDIVTKEEIMQSFFGDYKPGKSVKASKAKKKSSNSKKKKMSGYTLFGSMNKSIINARVKEEEQAEGEKPKFVTVQSKVWSEQNDQEKDNWNLQAKGFNYFCNKEQGASLDKWKALSDDDQEEWTEKASESQSGSDSDGK